MPLIRVLIADDHDTVRQGLRLLIEAQSDMYVIGEAPDGQTAIERVATLHPDVVVMDVTMPTLNGLEATRAIRSANGETAVVALTRHADQAYVQELLAAGAAAYVLKQSDSAQLIRAIRIVAAGNKYLDTTVASGSANVYLKKQPSKGTEHTTVTDRETEVLKQIAWGFSNKEIASTLGLSVKTVEVHKANATRKLDLRGRIDIVRYALLQGWLRDP